MAAMLLRDSCDRGSIIFPRNSITSRSLVALVNPLVCTERLDKSLMHFLDTKDNMVGRAKRMRSVDVQPAQLDLTDKITVFSRQKDVSV